MVFGVMREGFLGSGMNCRIINEESMTAFLNHGSCDKCDNGYTTLERGRGVCK